jgi:hypothetical protein
MRCVRPAARKGDVRNAYNILVEKTEEKRLLGKERCT